MLFHTLLSVLAITGTVTCSCLHGTTLLRREVTEQGRVKVSDFSYSGERGPLNWGWLNPNNTVCRTGTTQSPIIIDNSISKLSNNSAPVVKIPTITEATFENIGSTLDAIVSGTTMYQGKPYSLRQFHYHTPSEHWLRDEYYPLEMHMVHQAADGSLLVLVTLFQLSEDGCTTELVASSIENIEHVREPGTVSKTGRLDFTEIEDAFATGGLYAYTGSLTTPPCTEGVTFIVLDQPLNIDVKTYNSIKSVIKYNSRYIQNRLNETNQIQCQADQQNHH
ncbi:carbonic anhydrase [Moniliophthora roreri MCA 2997]|uniref:Carbonic anhydrase n=2 Tax=Moniliophthora roreri TaxID=221103 RepID=V2WJB1_MONRO|nr:carbonic anhydrase [Moniliophthora roreri MCA 2997]KAI3611301.1 carbonic anhydrase [Moniliophthora roreri]